MPERARRWISPEEYLALEELAETKSEYFNGEIFAMAGGTEGHSLIGGNILASLHGQLTSRPCRVYPSDMQIKCQATGLYTYPDATIVCGERLFEDAARRTLLNPTVVFTESYCGLRSPL